MLRKVLVYVSSYIVSAILLLINSWFCLELFDISDSGVGLVLFYASSFCVALVIFFFAGKLFLRPAGEKRKDLTVFIPGIILFAVCTIYYFIKVMGEFDSFNDFTAGYGFYSVAFMVMQVILLPASATLLPSLFLWLGMVSNKKKEQEKTPAGSLETTL